MKISYLKTRLLLLAFLGALVAPSSAANATKELCHPRDKRALLRIKQQLINTSIYSDLDSWVPATDCCGWLLVSCGSTNRVNSLTLFGVDDSPVGPTLPPAIGDLPYLDTLKASDSFIGPIPGFLAKLRRLAFLQLNNRHSGPIPSFLGSLPNLSTLILASNLLTGPIPPGLAQLAPISYLQLGNNQLTGTIPESLGSLKADQIMISVANNKLSGEIPRSFDKDKFSTLDFSGNRLEGDASFLFSKDKTEFFYLDLSDNSFSFDMTNLSITRRLGTLYLNNNKIYGRLPEALAHLPDFYSFNVSYNQLCGRIPAGALRKFDESSFLHNKCLCGHPLPHCR